MCASQHGHADVVRALLVSRAEVNAASASGWTALMAASRNGHASVAARERVNVNAVQRDGSTTALTLALQGEHAKVAQLLSHAGASQ